MSEEMCNCPNPVKLLNDCSHEELDLKLDLICGWFREVMLHQFGEEVGFVITMGQGNYYRAMVTNIKGGNIPELLRHAAKCIEGGQTQW